MCGTARLRPLSALTSHAPDHSAAAASPSSDCRTNDTSENNHRRIVMKKTVIIMAILAVFVSLTAWLNAAEEKPWFDMKNCDFCKNFLKDPQLLENMTWELHDISNGVLSLTVVTPEPRYEHAYQEAMQAMEDLAAEMAKGKTDVKMCGSCEFYGKLMMSGARFEHVHTCAGDVMLITSDKPEVLSMIREYADRTRKAMAEFPLGKTED
jgi:hypothetical protein